MRNAQQIRAAAVAERVIREHNVTALPVQPITIAERLGIEVVQKPASHAGVSGMLIRLGDDFCIAYATHISSPGFRRFSIAHELGHYFLEGHIDAIFNEGEIHESRAGFLSTHAYELEADHFAARLLMPNQLFSTALRRCGEGLAAVEALATLCETSLPATGIRFVECTREPVAVIVSTGSEIDFCAMSDALRDIDGIDWTRRRQPLPRNCITRSFNADISRVRRGERTDGDSSFQDWFGSKYPLTVTEEVRGLGSYGKTLTMLHGIELPEEADDFDGDEDNFVGSWTPRFRQ
jgi:Zn-dependent peptidase ImmA (M78 family)